MIELISRQSLLKKYDAKHIGPPGRARRLIEEEPTVEERKTGGWLDELRETEFSDCGLYETVCICSVCGADGDEEYNFCPNCGADMRGEQE